MNKRPSFEKHIKDANSWLEEIAQKTGTPNRTDWAYSALRSVLHTIRDRTTLQEVFHLSAQLPLLIRGMYFEGYKPVDKPDKINAEEFLQRISDEMGMGENVNPQKFFRAVMEVLVSRISAGELDDIRGTMPKDIRKLWDASLAVEN